MALLVTIPCQRCGHWLHLEWGAWLDRWPRVFCQPCQQKEK